MAKPKGKHNCLANATTFLNEHKVAVIGILLAVVVLGISLFLSIYSNYQVNSRVAEGNADTYKYLANISSGEEKQVYQEVAEKWEAVHQDFKAAARSRAYSANICLFSLVALLVACGLLSKAKLYCWGIPLVISLGFLLWAFLVFRFQWEYSWLDSVSSFLFGITM